MSLNQWKQLLKMIDVNGKLNPCSERSISSFETRENVALPASYKEYCQVFGTGRFSRDTSICSPCAKGDFNLLSENRRLHDEREYREYHPDPKQYERCLIFGLNQGPTLFMWDPARPTGNEECAIYACFVDWEVKHIADSFYEFVNEVLLGDNVKRVWPDSDSAERVFDAV